MPDRVHRAGAAGQCNSSCRNLHSQAMAKVPSLPGGIFAVPCWLSGPDVQPGT